jgi:uncharacterized protein YggE
MKSSRRTYVIIIFLFFSCKIAGQELDKSSVFISTSSVTQVPADAIYFSITISTQNDDPKKAYEEHKSLEKNLLMLIKEFEFPDSNISYSLMHIGKSSPYAKDKLGFQTRQVVSVKTEDFSKYEPFLLALLENGIYEYGAKFISEGKEEWIEKGIQEAISKSSTEAELTAKNLGKKLGGILNIETYISYPSESDGTSLAITGLPPGESLIDLPRFIQLRVSLRTRYELLEK